MYSAIMLMIIGGLVFLTKQIHLATDAGFFDEGAMILGFLILTAFFGGRLTNFLKMPRITGYILIGVLCGPYILHFVTLTNLQQIQFIDELALALIAFTAGAELQIDKLRQRFKSILWIILMQSLVTFGLMFIIILVSHHMVDILNDQPFALVIAFALVMSIISVAKSPAETIAVIIETRAKGIMTDTVLGVTVVKDIIVIVLFTVILSLAKSIQLGQTLNLSSVMPLFGEIGLSFIAGIFFGLIIIFYLRFVNKEMLVFVVVMVFFITQIAHTLHLEFLVTCMTAGFVVENFSRYGHKFLLAVERSSLPIYLVFFSIAGAGLNIPTLMSLWPVALIYVVSRISCVFIGTNIGARIAQDEPKIRNYSWAGFIGQAGVSLGFAIIVQAELPVIGETIKNIVVSMIVLNLLCGPVLFKWALGRAGEIGSEKQLADAPLPHNDKTHTEKY